MTWHELTDLSEEELVARLVQRGADELAARVVAEAAHDGNRTAITIVEELLD